MHIKFFMDEEVKIKECGIFSGKGASEISDAPKGTLNSQWT